MPALLPLRQARSLVALLTVALGACAQAQVLPDDEVAAPRPAAGAAVPAGSSATVVQAPLVLAGSSYTAEWYLPSAGDPQALVLVQHGFTRACANVRETGLRFARAGLVGLCLNAPMTGGNPALADALAAALAAGLVRPDGRAAPARTVVGGHSAGGLFASRVGFTLAAIAPSRLAGALLYDPVDAGGAMLANLRAVSAAGQRPVLAVTANPGPCNANGNAEPLLGALRAEALAAGRDGFVGLQLIDRSSHVDVEGRDAGFLASATCGAARRPNTEALRTLAERWATDAAAGTRRADAYPGGATVDGLLAAGQARLID